MSAFWPYWLHPEICAAYVDQGSEISVRADRSRRKKRERKEKGERRRKKKEKRGKKKKGRSLREGRPSIALAVTGPVSMPWDLPCRGETPEPLWSLMAAGRSFARARVRRARAQNFGQRPIGTTAAKYTKNSDSGSFHQKWSLPLCVWDGLSPLPLRLTGRRVTFSLFLQTKT